MAGKEKTSNTIWGAVSIIFCRVAKMRRFVGWYTYQAGDSWPVSRGEENSRCHQLFKLFLQWGEKSLPSVAVKVLTDRGGNVAFVDAFLRVKFSTSSEMFYTLFLVKNELCLIHDRCHKHCSIHSKLRLKKKRKEKMIPLALLGWGDLYDGLIEFHVCMNSEDRLYILVT